MRRSAAYCAQRPTKVQTRSAPVGADLVYSLSRELSFDKPAVCCAQIPPHSLLPTSARKTGVYT
jgi:hypothetical protein